MHDYLNQLAPWFLVIVSAILFEARVEEDTKYSKYFVAVTISSIALAFLGLFYYLFQDNLLRINYFGALFVLSTLFHTNRKLRKFSLHRKDEES